MLLDHVSAHRLFPQELVGQKPAAVTAEAGSQSRTEGSRSLMMQLSAATGTGLEVPLK